MRIADITKRSPAPEPWSEGDNIPWSEPGFSRRMLAEHLSDAHDAASRRPAKIDEQVAWLQREILGGQRARVLDLGCGPGLYTERLARLGHSCFGIDWSPASIEHAVSRAESERLDCRYICEDLRRADFGTGHGLALLIFGELNVFRERDASEILRRARASLAVGGKLVAEVHSLAAVQAIGSRPPRWRALPAGLFSDRPHLWLEESLWDPRACAATRRHFVVDAETGEVTRYASSLQAYSDAEYRALFGRAGFAAVESHPSLVGAVDPSQAELTVYAARAD